MARRSNTVISNDQYEDAMAWLEDGGTKKGACEILGIAYNTKRLDTLIEDHITRRDAEKRLRATKRKTAITPDESIAMITDYLRGESMQDLSNSYYRSVSVIKQHIEKCGADLRQSEAIDELRPPLLPEICDTDYFDVGEYAWSAKYGCIVRICKEVHSPQCKAYRIRVIKENDAFYSCQPVFDLGSLRHIKGIDWKNLSSNILTDPDGNPLNDEEIQQSINKAVHAANKRKD